MKIGIHVTTYNRLEFTKQCIQSILWSRPSNVIITIVDNASTDGTVEWLNELYDSTPMVTNIVFNKENMHLGYAVNQGWEILSKTCDILLWQNNDFLMEPGWEENVNHCFEDLKLDCVVGTVRPDRENIKKTTINGGTYTDVLDVGAAYFVTKECYEKGITPSITEFRKDYVGPGPSFHKKLKGLKFVRLAHPGVLVRDSEYNKPEYIEYYNKTMNIRGREDKLNKWRKMDKLGNPRGWCNWDSFLDKHYPDRRK
jgi:glycosyltransferase involved in cell wall biosynthesis